MELYSAEVENLKKLLGVWISDPNQELEATFGLQVPVNITTFLSVAQRLRAKDFNYLPEDDRLTITTPEHFRFSVVGPGDIQEYCRDDTLAGKHYSIMIKDRSVQQASTKLEDYDVSVKIRREEPIAKDDPKVGEMLKTWSQQRKAFRMIRRWAFKSRDEGFRIDMSIVRSTKRKEGAFAWQRKFKDQDIMNNPVAYEIEVELLHLEGDTIDTALKRLVKGIGEVLRGIQKNSLLIRKTTKDSVLRSYRELTHLDKFRGVAPITMELPNFTKERDEGTPNIRDGYNVTDKADGLRVLAFCDRKGELFLIDMGLNVYRTGLQQQTCRAALLDGEWVTKKKKMEGDVDAKATNLLLLFDIYIDIDGKDVTQLPFQGAEGESCRHDLLNGWVNKWNQANGPTSLIAGITAATKLKVSTKDFLFAAPGDKAIFIAAQKMLDSDKIYNTDGLIFTPNTLPLPQKAGVGFEEQFKWKPAEDNTIDFFVTFEKYTKSSEERIFIDVKADTGETIRYKTLRLYVGSSKESSGENARDIILEEKPILVEDKKNKYRPVLFTPKEFPDTMANICHLPIETDESTGEDYVITELSKEPIQDKSIVEMAYDPKRLPGWRWVPIRVRFDKTERFQSGTLSRTLNSDMTAEGVWNSIHEPITRSMICTGAEQPTEEEVADLIKSKAEREALGQRYFERKAAEQDLMRVKGLRDFHNKWIKEQMLYSSVLKGGRKTLVDLAVGVAADLQRWRRRHVSFVLGVDVAGKNIIGPGDSAYERYLSTMKYYLQDKAKAERVKKGEKKPYLLEVPPMVFAVADSSKHLVSGEAGASNQEKDILRSVFGKSEPQGPVPPFVEKYGASRLKMGADCVSLMFALHYFFESKKSFDGLLRNLADILKVGGYFIACFFDGEKVFNMLRGVETGSRKAGIEDDTLLWTITKQYEKDDLPVDDSGFGLGIDVEFITIGTAHREYLVPFKLLQEKMRQIGCELVVNKDELKELGLQHSTNTFDHSYDMAAKAGKKFQMGSAVKEFSFLNRWVIFKRNKDIPFLVEEEVAELPGALTAPGQKTGIGIEKTVIDELEKKDVEDRVATLVTMPLAERAAVLTALPAATQKETLAALPEELRTETSTAMVSVTATLKKKPRIVNKAATGLLEGVDTEEEAPQRTLVVEAAEEEVSGKKYAIGELFQFYDGASFDDALKIKDAGAGRWLSPTAPFAIPDADNTEVKYPSVEHYVAAMQYKLATNKPEAAKSLLSREGSIHQRFLQQRLLETNDGARELPRKRDYELLKEESDAVKMAVRPAQFKKEGAKFDSAKWATIKDKVLDDALSYRWKHDARLRKIVQAAKEQGKTLLYYTPGAGASNLGGVRKANTGMIQGENRIGKILMKLAEFPGY
jgi:hypothetical protein